MPNPDYEHGRFFRTRRACLALMVVSRLWSTTTLTPALLTAGLAAPSTALALPDTGEQGGSSEASSPQALSTPPPIPDGQTGGIAAPSDAGVIEASTDQPTSTGSEKLLLPKKRHEAGKRHRRHHRKKGVHRARRHQKSRRLRRTPVGRTGGVAWHALKRVAKRVRTADVDRGAVNTSVYPPSPPVFVPAGLSAGLSQPPAFLVGIYKQAGKRYDVPWRVLAAINAIETGYGSDLSVSSQGAIGWMQFMPQTWLAYGEGGNPYDPHDAIFAAARLLAAAGAAHDLPAAIFAYNHADWYVAAVLWRASTIETRPFEGKGHRYALPLGIHYMEQLGRTDDGVDIETAPDGSPVFSMTPGIVVAVASDPTGFGPDYPVILVTSGPLTGSYIYYGHVAASLVTPGQHVAAGEPIAIVGHTGDAAGLGHGHIEIGFCDSTGNPLDHHGEQAWTPAGQTMRLVLTSLYAKLTAPTPKTHGARARKPAALMLPGWLRTVSSWSLR